MNDGLFGREIEAHLELQRRNSRLERRMPISQYRETVVEVVDSAVGRRAVAGEVLDADEPTAADARSAAPWDDPDSWWNVVDPSFDWSA